jgi:hypothetical protein
VDEQRFEDALSRALGSYSASEPLTGLEARVLARVRRAPARSYWWAWVAGAVALILVCVLVGVRQEVRPVRAPVRASAPVVVEAVHHQEPVVMRARRQRRVLPVKPRLSREELVLARYVASDPEGAVKAFASLRENSERELKIEPLEVKPIQMESLQ